jgi:SAM-dependent methyltransferase
LLKAAAFTSVIIAKILSKSAFELGSEGKRPTRFAADNRQLIFILNQRPREPILLLLVMSSNTQNLVSAYDEKYRRPNFFRYHPWLYRSYIRALAKKTGLANGSRVLDVGCGQGFFTGLFADLGMKALGVDISAEAVRSAIYEQSSSGARFEVGDAMSLPYKNTFDCVFLRSCSLYNSGDFEANREFTDILLGYVKRGGVLIFDYYSKMRPTKSDERWRHHSFEAVKKHFSRWPQARIYFSLRLDAIVLNTLALSTPVTWLALLANRSTGIGGELVAIVPKSLN